jgi:hypothetical protein
MNNSFLKLSRIIGLGVVLGLAGSSAWAEESTSAMAAPKCDLEKIQKLCEESEDCVKVEKGAWEGGYNVTSKDKEAETRFMTEVVIKNCM